MQLRSVAKSKKFLRFEVLNQIYMHLQIQGNTIEFVKALNFFLKLLLYLLTTDYLVITKRKQSQTISLS